MIVCKTDVDWLVKQCNLAGLPDQLCCCLKSRDDIVVDVVCVDGGAVSDKFATLTLSFRCCLCNNRMLFWAQLPDVDYDPACGSGRGSLCLRAFTLLKISS